MKLNGTVIDSGKGRSVEKLKDWEMIGIRI